MGRQIEEGVVFEGLPETRQTLCLGGDQNRLTFVQSRAEKSGDLLHQRGVRSIGQSLMTESVASWGITMRRNREDRDIGT